MVRHEAMKEKKIIDGKFPTYTFRLDPALIKRLESIKGKDSWNKLLKELEKAYEQRKFTEND